MEIDGLLLLTTLALLTLPPVHTASSSYYGTTPVEVCAGDKLQISCGENEILVINNATYGRMRMGQCVKQDFGYLGCSTNVLEDVHRLCSGRQSCEFMVAILKNIPDQGCPKDLSSYLYAEYSCVKVVTCDASKCQKSDFLRVSPPSGYFSSEVTWKTGCGTATCPWVIQADPGQRINITLYDFSKGRDPTRDRSGKFCYKYATLKGKDAVNKDVTVCTGEGASSTVRPIFLSEEEMVYVTLYTPSNKDDLLYFALKYEVVGCPEIEAPRHAVVRRQGALLTVYCNATQETWTLRCDGKAWVGEMGTCPLDTWTPGGLVATTDNQTFGMLLIIGLGVVIGIVVGGMLLAIALVYLRKRKRHTTQTTATEVRLLEDRGYYCDGGRYKKGQGVPVTAKDIPTMQYRREHDYTCTLPLRGTPKALVDPCTKDIKIGFAHGDNEVKIGVGYGDMEDGDTFPPPPTDLFIRDHVYESPRFPLPHGQQQIRGFRTQSADGIARKAAEAEESKNNRTN